MGLKFSIGHRLFAAALLSTLALGAIGLELVRWQLLDNFSAQVATRGADRLDDLAEALSAQYRQHGDWSFLPTDPAQRKAWLREAWWHARPGRDARLDAQTSSSHLDERIGLLDKDQRYLAGVMAHPWIVAFASIDTLLRPLVVNGEAVGYLVLAAPQNPNDALAVAFLIDQQGNFLIVALAGLLLSVGAAALLAAHFRRPVRQLVAGAQALESGQFDARITVRRSDELGELAEAFNRLASRLDEAESSRREWVANTSHELRTPLSVLRAQMESLQDGVREASPENIALMQRQVQALAKLVDELYELARADVGQAHDELTVRELWPLVCETFDGFAEKFRAAGLQAALSSLPVRSSVCCDAEKMRRVLANLLENSVRYTAADGRVELSGKVLGQELHIVMDDSAPGVSEASLARLGERFFRGEASRSRQFGGAGLGLALSRQILEAHGGRLAFEPSPLGGLRVIVILPLAPQ